MSRAGSFDRRGGAQGGDDGWGDEYGEGGYTAPPAGRSGGRGASGDYGTYGGYDGYGDEYAGVDASRALVPQYGEPMPPSAEGGLMSGLPGFPQTDEEERALGIRRPVYIPATGEKRKRKLSSARIVSGTASILVVTLLLCGGLGFLGQRQIAKFIGGAIKTSVTPAPVDLSQVPLKPASTPGAAAKIVTSATTARGIDKEYNAEDITSYFTVNSTVYVVVNIVGASQSGMNKLTCRWFLNGIDYNLKSGTSYTVQSTKTNNFHGYCGLPYYQTGIGMVKIYWNKPDSDSGDAPNDKYLAQTIKFAVLTALPSTPAAGTPKPGTPVPSPTKKAYSGSSPEAWRSEQTAG